MIIYSGIFDVVKLLLQLNKEISHYHFLNVNQLLEIQSRKIHGLLVRNLLILFWHIYLFVIQFVIPLLIQFVTLLTSV